MKELEAISSPLDEVAQSLEYPEKTEMLRLKIR